MIRQVMKQADLVISVTQTLTEQARKEHAGLDPEKFVTMTNGFDPHDFEGLAKHQPTSRPIIFSYIGVFDYGRTPEPFLRALRSLFEEGELKPCDVQVKFVGNVAVAEGQSVAQMVRNFGLEEIVSVEAPVPRREALQRALASHVLLVLTEKHSYALTFKVFDSLAAGAIIFNIGSGGEVADLLAKTKRGISADYSNVVQIRAGILECIERSRSGDRQRSLDPWNAPSIQTFNFQYLTRELAKQLDRLGFTASGLDRRSEPVSG
jgi:glycosyltransferase involved in cell wall biosynthesis